MAGPELEQRLFEILANRLDSSTARQLVTVMAQAGVAVHLLELLSELREISEKLMQEAIGALPEVHHRCGPDTLVPWLDLAISLAGSSGATTLKYIRESPRLLGILDTPVLRQHVLVVALEVADGDSEFASNCAFEFFRKAPELLMVVAHTELQAWADIGLELAEWNYVLGIEFFRESPKVAEVLHQDQVRAWVGFGMKLMTQNSLGKPDYLGTLEFFRSSPAILGDLPEATLRTAVVSMGSVLADRSPHAALTFLADAPHLLRSIPTPEWRLKVLQYGGLLAERDAEVALEYLRRCPDVLGLVHGGESHEAFEAWFRGGMEILDYSAEGARAFFRLETGRALASLEKAMSGVPLRQVARSLKLFGNMLCGEDIRIESLPDPVSLSRATPHSLGSPHPELGGAEGTPDLVGRAKVSSDGKTLYLPALVNRFPTRQENLRFYTVMTAHEIGHLEFGTYRIDLGRLQGLAQTVRGRYSSNTEGVPPVATLADLFDLYPHKGVIRDLWTVLEDARVDYRLQHEYPGFRRDLTALAQEAVTTRSFLHGVTVREMVIDSLLVLFVAEPGSVPVREDLQLVVDRAWSHAQAVLRPDSTAEDAIQAADRIYHVMDEMISSLQAVSKDDPNQKQAEEEADLGPGPRAAEETSGVYRPITNWAYRGALDPEMVRGQGDSPEPAATQEVCESGLPEGHGSDGGSSPTKSPGDKEVIGKPEAEDHRVGVEEPSVIDQWLAVKTDREGALQSRSGDGRSFLYDEWDGLIQDYRSKWCRVIERPGPEGSQDFAQATLEAHAPAVRLLRRYFEAIRPAGLRRVHGQEDGEEVDLDAALQRMVDRRAGADLSDRIYIRRDKRERRVAAAFLIDMSGSTGRQIESGGRRVIDVEKEGLVLLSEALDAIGDQYALYGFSGQGRDRVDFVVIKDFEETLRYRTGQRIEAITPLQQNRDGAAIRHAVTKLLGCPARHRLLILLSDGKPLDDGYADEYALEDTKMALREARLAGISPFCLTIDRDASGYLKRMYGDVRYLVLDDVSVLPERLPKIYRRLTTS